MQILYSSINVKLLLKISCLDLKGSLLCFVEVSAHPYVKDNNFLYQVFLERFNDLFRLLKITEDPKQFSVFGLLSINIYHNLN